MKTKLLIGYFAFFLSMNSIGQTPAENCKKDLDFIPAFLLENDAGAKDHRQHNGQEKLDIAYSEARNRLKEISSANECDVLIKSYLLSWRKDHINVRSTRPSIENKPSSNISPEPQKPSLEPSLELLSENTALLVIRSFRSRYKNSIEKLLQNNETELEKRPNWIIDVRRNGGGSDSSYQALLPWFVSNEIVNVETSWLATPINIQANASICQLAAPNDPSCPKMIEPVLSLMKSTKNGEFTQSTKPYDFQLVSPRDSAAERRVAVLMGQRCGSTCEQFLLTVRQAFNVKLLGRNSAGALDYSNLRPYSLPSGERDLIYAISRSHRLPFLPVDITGVLPDILLPQPQNEKESAREIIRVKNWLEGGSLDINVDIN